MSLETNSLKRAETSSRFVSGPSSSYKFGAFRTLSTLNKARKLIIAGALSLTVGFSTQAVSDEALVRLINSIKVELAQHTGIIGGFDPKTGIVTLSGTTRNMSAVKTVIDKIKSIDGVTEVRSSIFKH